jgi:hypothetical protein
MTHFNCPNCFKITHDYDDWVTEQLRDSPFKIQWKCDCGEEFEVECEYEVHFYVDKKKKEKSNEFA